VSPDVRDAQQGLEQGDIVDRTPGRTTEREQTRINAAVAEVNDRVARQQQGIEQSGAGSDQVAAAAIEFEERVIEQSDLVDDPSDVRIVRDGDTLRAELTPTGAESQMVEGPSVGEQARSLEQRVIDANPGITDPDQVRVVRDGDTLQVELTAEGAEAVGQNPTRGEVAEQVAADNPDVLASDLAVESSPFVIQQVDEGNLTGGPGFEVSLTEEARADRQPTGDEVAQSNLENMFATTRTEPGAGDRLARRNLENMFATTRFQPASSRGAVAPADRAETNEEGVLNDVLGGAPDDAQAVERDLFSGVRSAYDDVTDEADAAVTGGIAAATGTAQAGVDLAQRRVREDPTLQSIDRSLDSAAESVTQSEEAQNLETQLRLAQAVGEFAYDESVEDAQSTVDSAVDATNGTLEAVARSETAGEVEAQANLARSVGEFVLDESVEGAQSTVDNGVDAVSESAQTAARSETAREIGSQITLAQTVGEFVVDESVEGAQSTVDREVDAATGAFESAARSETAQEIESQATLAQTVGEFVLDESVDGAQSTVDNSVDAATGALEGAARSETAQNIESQITLAQTVGEFTYDESVEGAQSRFDSGVEAVEAFRESDTGQEIQSQSSLAQSVGAFAYDRATEQVGETQERVIETSDEIVDSASETTDYAFSQGGTQTVGGGLAGAAVAGVVAPEPVSTGAGLVTLGGIAVAGAAGAALTNEANNRLTEDDLIGTSNDGRTTRVGTGEGTTGSELSVPENGSPVVSSEMDATTGDVFTSELEVSTGGPFESEFETPADPNVGTGGEIGIPSLATSQFAQQQRSIQRQERQRRRERNPFREGGSDLNERREILRGPEEGVTLGEEVIRDTGSDFENVQRETFVEDRLSRLREESTTQDSATQRLEEAQATQVQTGVGPQVDPIVAGPTERLDSATSQTVTADTGLQTGQALDQSLAEAQAQQQNLAQQQAAVQTPTTAQAQAQLQAQGQQLVTANPNAFGNPTVAAPGFAEPPGFTGGPPNETPPSQRVERGFGGDVPDPAPARPAADPFGFGVTNPIASGFDVLGAGTTATTAADEERAEEFRAGVGGATSTGNQPETDAFGFTFDESAGTTGFDFDAEAGAFDATGFEGSDPFAGFDEDDDQGFGGVL
jgi:hypothetical protein